MFEHLTTTDGAAAVGYSHRPSPFEIDLTIAMDDDDADGIVEGGLQVCGTESPAEPSDLTVLSGE